jgi:hypothetical protein
MVYSNLAPYGEFFLKQGRPEFPLRGCVIFCIAKYEVKSSGESRRITTLGESYRLFIHAEESILREIETTEQESHS